MYRAFVEFVEPDRVTLPSEELHHLLRVRRTRAGDDFLGFDPERGWLRCRLQREGGRWFGMVLEPVTERWESPLRILLGQALIKKDRFEWVIQKAVELGVSEIIPLITTRSELRLERNQQKRLDRWRKILRESMKQCGRNQLPRLRDPIPLKSFLAEELPAVKFVLDEAGDVSLRDQARRRESLAECLLIVGPEGGWDDRDRQLLREANCLPVKLGPRILRAETAPVAGLAILQYEWGDLGGGV